MKLYHIRKENQNRKGEKSQKRRQKSKDMPTQHTAGGKQAHRQVQNGAEEESGIHTTRQMAERAMGGDKNMEEASGKTAASDGTKRIQSEKRNTVKITRLENEK